jgi:uncharacterized protein (DUF1778 family)
MTARQHRLEDWPQIRIDIVYTPLHSPTMNHHGSSPETKGTINLRIDAYSRQLIDEAASKVGKTRTEFMLESARNSAVDVILDQRLFSLDDKDFRTFAAALENPPAVGPKLKALMRRKPVWKVAS